MDESAVVEMKTCRKCGANRHLADYGRGGRMKTCSACYRVPWLARFAEPTEEQLDGAQKVCRKCGVAKPEEHFKAATTCRDGRRHTCKKCTKAYEYARRKGAKKQQRDDLATRLWASIDKSGGADSCWCWTGKRTEGGFGTISGRLPGTAQTRTLHVRRVAYELSVGPIPAGLDLAHAPGVNKLCCNPLHLQPAPRSARAKAVGDAVLAERFWGRVDMSGGPDVCWPWTAGCNMFGYGIASQPRGKNRGHAATNAHRRAWALANGPIPKGANILHSCDNPPCCNPHHLRVGTASDNMRDMWGRNRHPRLLGEEHPRSKLSDARVREIRKKRKRGVGVAALARKYGVCNATILYVTSGGGWSHVD